MRYIWWVLLFLPLSATDYTNKAVVHCFRGYVMQKNAQNFRLSFYVVPASKEQLTSTCCFILPEGASEYQTLEVKKIRYSPYRIETNIGVFVLNRKQSLFKSRLSKNIDEISFFQCLHTQISAEKDR